MAFSQADITDGPWLARSGFDLAVWWRAAAPAAVHQLYVNRRLRWTGTGDRAVLPYPKGPIRVDVGTVGVGETEVDFSGSLAALADGPTLQWYGGTYLDETIRGFRVYGEPSPGAGVDYATPLDYVRAYEDGIILDGAGMGPAGYGGAGLAASSYTWTGPHYPPGAWTFAVRPVNAAGHEGPASTWAVTIAGPPRPPAADPVTGRRLGYTLDPTTGVPTLNWTPSPP
jgi:hypothetical protein